MDRRGSGVRTQRGERQQDGRQAGEQSFHREASNGGGAAVRGCGVGRSEKTGRQRRIINEMTVHSKGVTRRCRFPKQESRCSFEKCNLTPVLVLARERAFRLPPCYSLLCQLSQ